MSETVQRASSHRIILEGREKLTVNGVEDVLNFDERVVVLKTTMGILSIDGEGLRMTALNVTTKDVDICGKVNGMIYQENRVTKGRLLKRKEQ